MEKTNNQELRDMVFRGAFLVVLVYILVFLYNSGILTKIFKRENSMTNQPSKVMQNLENKKETARENTDLDASSEDYSEEPEEPLKSETPNSYEGE